MGSISFLLPNVLPDAARAMLRSACFTAGFDQAPVPTTLQVLDDRLIASWELNESRYLSLPWPIPPFSTLIATTATLRETTQPYRLLVELARGKLNQVRLQAADWIGIGLRTPPGFEQALAESGKLFSTALSAAPDEADSLSARVLEQSHMLGDTLTREFIAQLFDTRHQDEGLLDTRLAARTHSGFGGARDEYTRAFNAAQIGLCWKDIEPEESRFNWDATDQAVQDAKVAGLPITLGPVIDLAPGMIPEWGAGWKGDLPALAAFMCDFTERVVNRYKNDVRRWVVCAGFNQSAALELDDDERLRLAFRLFEAAASIDSDLELVVSIAQPWGDYLVNKGHTIAPITFADDLLRTGIKISAIELELRLGSTPRGSRPRDLLEAWRIMQLFGGLNMKLEILLSLPASAGADDRAVSGESTWNSGAPANYFLEAQADFGTALAGLALAFLDVRAVTWDHWSDSQPHIVPFSGLLDSAGCPKPLLTRLGTLRSAHLR
ncbi:MAG TPA: hypothetical protein VLM40_07830 [Gemmata sp.]|nr:hypothetical protein [Gemmata sp.]